MITKCIPDYNQKDQNTFPCCTMPPLLPYHSCFLWKEDEEREENNWFRKLWGRRRRKSLLAPFLGIRAWFNDIYLILPFSYCMNYCFKIFEGKI